MKFVEVLPLVKTGTEDNIFTYETEEEVCLGSLVSIPLRNRFVKGMVVGLVKKPSFKTKQVKKILSLEPVLSEIQLKLAKKIAEYYCAPLGDVINSMLSFDFGKKRRTIDTEKLATSKPEQPLKLTTDQKKAFDQIAKGQPSSKHLLFGVTGSGKTEIYLQLIAEALKDGGGAIVLVPEISLTPQTLSRFQKRFGEKVAVWHSQMKETEKYHTWQAIKAGEKNVVVGARSALFSPVADLRYIIIDEEHESSYKQDQTPRYEATRVAEWLAELSRAKLVLGSATPKIESYFKATEKDYQLTQLSKRIVQEEMPPVKIVDLRDEFKKGNKSIFSDDLINEITSALKRKKQIMLFVNRRGASTFIVCRDCGFVSSCPNCDIPLTYHPSEGQVLKCHHCDHKTTVPTTCPSCGSFAIRYFGLGTQKVELEAKKTFPLARISRMDRDTTQKRGSHEEIFTSFSENNYDILIGTQLIAKGWDLPNVAVVGVISADTNLNLPDFRSAERTFSLLSQVSGRTGRGKDPGKVVVQTYAPENYAVTFAAKHDFPGFFETEIKERQKYHYPPFSQLIKLTFSSESAEKTEKEAFDFFELLTSNPLKNCHLLGPAPSFIPKLAGKYRWQIIIKATRDQNIIEILKNIKPLIKKGWVIDVNPESLL